MIDMVYKIDDEIIDYNGENHVSQWLHTHTYTRKCTHTHTHTVTPEMFIYTICINDYPFD